MDFTETAMGEKKRGLKMSTIVKGSAYAVKNILCLFERPFKEKKNGVLFFEYLHSFQRYSSFCSKIDDVTNRFSTKIDNKIKNILGNIGVMLLKLGTNNENQVRNKMTPIMTFPWFSSRPHPLSVMNQTSPFLTRSGEADSPT